MADDGIHYFGIRHHGPGCAHSLVQALSALSPDCVLVEGPAGAEALLAHVGDAQLKPPVALLSHATDDPQLAVFHPYAQFSPEWQALRWAQANGVPAQFIDLPAAVNLAWARADREARAAALAAGPPDPANGPADDAEGTLAATAAEPAPNAETAPSPAVASPNDDSLAPPTIGHEDTAAAHDSTAVALSDDPLDWLARAAGYGDGETWWNQMVEERGDGEGLFDAIRTAMTEVRQHAPVRSGHDAEREAVREAHMRRAIRDAGKAGHACIAVICGAWHVPALAAPTTAAVDNKLLKGLPTVKTQTTWIPWSYQHLSMRSGYGAGIAHPGWYAHLWAQRHAPTQRAVGWYARVARLLREHGLDCSSAHLIEATRLADAMAAMRDRPAPGLEEIGDATRSVICNGDDVQMQLIADALLVGDVLGEVPNTVPTVPLQRDLEAQQKRLRLKAETLEKTLDLDLRNDTDLQRSHLLHRLGLLDIGWGRLATVGRSSRGTFHEVWTLAWQPQFQLDLIIASRHGATLAQAASACAADRARQSTHLAELATLVDRVLLADLPAAVPIVAAELEARSATDGDPLALLAALPALANVHRYGNVRRTDAAQVAHLFDGILLRACVGLALALCELDTPAAEAARETLIAADRAVTLRDDPECSTTWQSALHTAAHAESTAPLLRGLCTRLLLDGAALPSEDAAALLQLSLSPGQEPLDAAEWLDGFLNRNATVLLHGDSIWPLIDQWLATLGDDAFLRVAPLVRRTFSGFEAADRRDLGLRVRAPAHTNGATATHAALDDPRALRALPMLRELMGVSP